MGQTLARLPMELGCTSDFFLIRLKVWVSKKIAMGQEERHVDVLHQHTLTEVSDVV